MQTNTKAVLIGFALFAAGSAFYSRGSRNATLDHIIDRFPDRNIDRKVAIGVYNEMMRESLFGKYKNLEMNTETFNTIFLSKYRQITHE